VVTPAGSLSSCIRSTSWVPPCRSRPRCVLISWLTRMSPRLRHTPGQDGGNGKENWCFGMSTKIASTAMIEISQGPSRPKSASPSERENERPWALDH